MTSGSLTDALLAVHDVLAAAEIPHALCGGLAANLYREEVRATVDVDIAVAVAPARVVDLVNRFEAEGWKVEPYWRRGEQLRLTRNDLPRIDCIWRQLITSAKRLIKRYLHELKATNFRF